MFGPRVSPPSTKRLRSTGVIRFCEIPEGIPEATGSPSESTRACVVVTGRLFNWRKHTRARPAIVETLLPPVHADDLPKWQVFPWSSWTDRVYTVNYCSFHKKRREGREGVDSLLGNTKVPTSQPGGTWPAASDTARTSNVERNRDFIFTSW